MSTPPRPAATIVLARNRGDRIEVYLVKRSGRSGFMGGAHVFPGGRVDAADGTLVGSLEPQQASSTESWMISARVAACRELLEEAGVLLGSHPEKAPAVRARLTQGESFAAALLAEGASIDLRVLTYFAHWITPSFEPKRYDTRFFLSELPEGVEASVDGHEIVEGRWATPRVAIEAHERGDIFLPPPTLVTLVALSEFQSVEAARQSLETQPIHTVLPKVRAAERAFEILFPWDAEYQGAEGDAVEFEGPAPAGPSRVVIRGF
ncbi:MAG: NUDIX domain-containing protein [Deltaproteobacteria bacterium]|nr:NUDIX domain-containing protein [Deltaproteobacteria bacterium]